MSKIHLTVVSQEKKLLDQEVDSITAPASEGLVTILPHHAPLMSKLSPGEVIYREEGKENSLVISRGFIDVAADSRVTIMVDTARHIREISLEKARAAVEAAHKTMEKSTNQRELIMAEASLKLAMIEIRLVHKTKKAQI